MAIESVYVWGNDSVVVDEVFSHRLGLIPLNIDPALVDMKDSTKVDGTDMATDRNTIVFTLAVQCLRNPNASKNATDPSEIFIDHEVRSGHLVWKPAGEQEEVFATRPPAPLNKDIVLTKLRPGMGVNMEVHAVKGVGKEHAKFSPVGVSVCLSRFYCCWAENGSSATASYRLLPHIQITRPIPPSLAEKFQKCFAPGVIRVDPQTKEVSVDEHNVRKDPVSREVLRHPEFADSVQLGRVRDHFLCESGGFCSKCDSDKESFSFFVFFLFFCEQSVSSRKARIPLKGCCPRLSR